MKWLTVAVEAKFGWPTEETEIEYFGHTYLLRPEGDKHAQSVSLRCPAGCDVNSGRLLISRFLSALSWAEEAGISELSAVGSDGHPVHVGKSNTRLIAQKFKADYLPEPEDDRALRALALFREAQSLNSAAYSFLGFYKILNILFSSAKDQKSWINANITAVSHLRSTKRLKELQTLHDDLGDYLYVQGRCAVAHAYNDPVVDPDKPEEIQRLIEDLPLIKELAAIAIESELGIISKSTYHKVHLYELEGFEKLLGEEVVECLKRGDSIEEIGELDIPLLSIRLRDHKRFDILERLSVMGIQQHEKSLIIKLHSEDDLVQLIVILDFGEWRLIFDPLEQLRIYDDGSPRPMLARSDAALFAKGKYLNGQIEIINAENSELLARTDPFVPVNVDLGGTAENLDRISAEALKEAGTRAKQNA